MVRLRENETLDSLISRFKSDVKRSGKLEVLKNKERFVCKSRKKKLKREAHKRLVKTLQSKNQKRRLKENEK